LKNQVTVFLINMNKFIKSLTVFVLTLSSLFVVSSSLFVNTAKAVCPVCTVAVVAGLGISEELGIDDVVTSIWIGGLILSASFWTIDWIEKSKYREKIYKHICKFKCGMTENQALKFWTIFLMYLLVFVPLLFTKAVGVHGNTLWGVDKIILGTAVGSIMFAVGMWADKKVRKTRDGHQLFIFQKVVFPVLSLIISSLVFYFITK
jgi:hypothetical protein